MPHLFICVRAQRRPADFWKTGNLTLRSNVEIDFQNGEDGHYMGTEAEEALVWHTVFGVSLQQTLIPQEAPLCFRPFASACQGPNVSQD